MTHPQAAFQCLLLYLLHPFKCSLCLMYIIIIGRILKSLSFAVQSMEKTVLLEALHHKLDREKTAT